jgi:hypothetical protein
MRDQQLARLIHVIERVAPDWGTDDILDEINRFIGIRLIDDIMKIPDIITYRALSRTDYSASSASTRLKV